MYKNLADKLAENSVLDRNEYLTLIRNRDSIKEYTAKRACEVRRKHYGDRVFIRGLIEFTNYCRNDCFYCGIRAGNRNADRYRLSPEEILSCADAGYELGFRTFVLQGGEDPWFTDEIMVDIISNLKDRHPD